MNHLVKNSALKRILSILDENSFVEIGASVTARPDMFHLNNEKLQADGVITGYGLVDGRLVYLYSQDASVFGGSISEKNSQKIIRLYDMAIKMGAPIIGIIDCSGVRLFEGYDALYGLGSIYRKQVSASGIIPQFSIIMGNCGGGTAMIPALSDFTFVESQKGSLFLQSPDTIPSNHRDKCDTASVTWRASHTKNIDFCGTEAEICNELKHLLQILPSNHRFDIMPDDCSDSLNRLCDGICELACDSAQLLSLIGDDSVFIETKKLYAKELATGFIQLNGMTVGCIANRSLSGTEILTDRLTASAVKKAAAFIKYCDAFHIPLLTLCNTSGFDSSFESEISFCDSCAAMLTSYASASVPKVTLILEKALGSAGTIMGSQSVGSDLVYAWKDAKIGAMDSLMAARILYEGESSSVIKEKEAQYDAACGNADACAAHGYIDAIINPEQTRKFLISAFDMLSSKQEVIPSKRHHSI